MSTHDGIVLRVCRGHKCGKFATALEAAIREVIASDNLDGEVGLAQEACFGKCFIGPNILVERWRNGKRNEQAMFAVMMNQNHDDARFEHGIAPEDVPKMLRWHVRKLREQRDNER